MTRQRIHVSRDVTLIAEHADGIEIEGRVRLRPGHTIEVGTSADGAPPTIREAIVWSWYVKRVGASGPVFRGICHWA